MQSSRPLPDKPLRPRPAAAAGREDIRKTMDEHRSNTLSSILPPPVIGIPFGHAPSMPGAHQSMHHAAAPEAPGAEEASPAAAVKPPASTLIQNIASVMRMGVEILNAGLGGATQILGAQQSQTSHPYAPHHGQCCGPQEGAFHHGHHMQNCCSSHGHHNHHGGCGCNLPPIGNYDCCQPGANGC